MHSLGNLFMELHLLLHSVQTYIRGKILLQTFQKHSGHVECVEKLGFSLSYFLVSCYISCPVPESCRGESDIRAYL